MTKMKDSGIRWIGEIPENWEIYSLKHLFQMFAGGDIDEYDFSEEYTEQTPYPIYSNSLENKGLFGYTSKYRFSGNTFTVTGRGDVGKAIVRNDSYYPIVRLLVCVPIQKDDTRYFAYCVNSADLLGEQTAMAQLTTQKLGINKFPRPNIKEQQVISSFLNDKVKKIDEILNDLNNQIELLNKYKKSLITETVIRGLNPNVELKDSGVDWIGMIPESWIENKIKYIAKVNGRVGFKGYSKDDLVGPDEGAYTIGGKHISTNKLNLDEPEYISWEKYYESPEIMIHKNDIIMSQRGTLGKVVIIEDDIGEATINPSLVLLNKIDINNKFLYWIINSDVIREKINVVNTSTAVPMISQTQIGNFKICIPPRKEQGEIANYLDKKCDEIDKIILDKQTQIEKMEKYKKSLIYEYVTGKKRVKGAEELYG